MKAYTYAIVSLFFLFSCEFTQTDNKNQDVSFQTLNISTTSNSPYQYVKTLPESHKYMYAFSRYAKPGKITLFITSAHWCAPCKRLIDRIENAYRSREISIYDVETYIVKVTTSNHDTKKVLNKRSGYKMLKEIDLLTKSFPMTYICSPTTNCYNVVEGLKYEEIMTDITTLKSMKDKYFDPNYLRTNSGKQHDYAFLFEENTRLKSELATLRKQVKGGIINQASYNNANLIKIDEINFAMNDARQNKIRLALKYNENYSSEVRESIIENTVIRKEENRLIIISKGMSFPDNSKIQVSTSLGFFPILDARENRISIFLPDQNIVSYSKKINRSMSSFYIDIIVDRIR